MRTRVLGSALAMLILIASAKADSIFTLGQHLGPAQNVLVGTQVGSRIEGVTNQTGMTVVFRSMTNILTGTSGHAAIIAANRAPLNNVTITVPGFFFSSILIDPVERQRGDIMVMVRLAGGKIQNFTYPGTTGNNFLTITTINSELISSVTINSKAGFESLSHTRFRSAPGSFVVVPEANTLGLFGTGMVGLFGMIRRKLQT